MTKEEMAGFIRGIAPVIRSELDQRDVRIAALERRIADLEARPRMVYRGTWAPDAVYGIGEYATDHGSVWHCNAAAGTRERPGNSAAWTLAVKRGRDAR